MEVLTILTPLRDDINIKLKIHLECPILLWLLLHVLPYLEKAPTNKNNGGINIIPCTRHIPNAGAYTSLFNQNNSMRWMLSSSTVYTSKTMPQTE